MKNIKGRGQALVEFAIVVPVFMLLLAGMIQFGIILWGQNTLNQVVRDTGRWAATQTACNSSTGQLVIDTANSIAAQSSLIGYRTGEFTTTNMTVAWPSQPSPHDTDPCPPVDSSQVRFVTISITHPVPIFFPWVPGNGVLTSSAEFRVEPAP